MANTLAELVAMTFHRSYEEKAPDYGYKTRDATAKPWDDLPLENKGLMIATAAEVLEKLGLLGLHVRMDGEKVVVDYTAPPLRKKTLSIPPPAPTTNGYKNGHAAPVELNNGQGDRIVQLHPTTVLAPSPTDTFLSPTSSKQARDKGYTGDACEECQQMTLKRNGTCLLCDSCGATTGCS